MADEKDFAKELSALIKRYLDGGCDPQDIADELLREANSVSGTTTSKSISKRSLLPGVKYLRARLLGACSERLALRVDESKSPPAIWRSRGRNQTRVCKVVLLQRSPSPASEPTLLQPSHWQGASDS